MSIISHTNIAATIRRIILRSRNNFVDKQ